MTSVKDIAKMIDHSLLHPVLTDADIDRGCALAECFGVASVCVKPYGVGRAASRLKDSDVAVGTVVGFPHGGNSIGIKVAEAEEALKDGAVELDMVVNLGKVIAGEWEYVKDEIERVALAAHDSDGLLKVIFENDHLNEENSKTGLCRVCSEAGADFIKTSTGFGFTRRDNGSYSYDGATEEDVILMRKNAPPEVKIKAAGGIRTLDEFLRFRNLGVDRIGVTATESIMNEARKKFTGSDE